MGLPSKEYGSTTEEFGETKLNPQRIPYFFQSTPIEILNFMAYLKNFFLVLMLNAIGLYGEPSRFLHCKESILNWLQVHVQVNATKCKPTQVYAAQM